MSDTAIPDGFTPTQFSPGFLDHGGPYFFRSDESAAGVIGLRIEPHHINFQNAAHGGVISTFADVALSHAVYHSESPPLMPSTINLSVNYLLGSRLGDWLEAHVQVDRMGGRTAYTSGRILRGDDIIATMSGVFSIKRQTQS
jgi:uncharacterized protein (TIGR00369 family)